MSAPEPLFDDMLAEELEEAHPFELAALWWAAKQDGDLVFIRLVEAEVARRRQAEAVPPADKRIRSC